MFLLTPSRDHKVLQKRAQLGEVFHRLSQDPKSRDSLCSVMATQLFLAFGRSGPSVLSNLEALGLDYHKHMASIF